jgi:hypothetical protein
MKYYEKAKHTRPHAAKQEPEPNRQPRDIQRRINAGWLRLWKDVYPNTPPPVTVQSLKPKVQSPGSGVQAPKSKGETADELKLRKQKAEIGKGWRVQGPKSGAESQKAGVQRPKHGGHGSGGRRPAAVAYLSGFLCAGFALAVLAAGCTGPRPLKGGKASTTHKPGGVTEQTLVQGENSAQPTRQAQQSVKVRTYTVPAGTRIEQSLNAEYGVRNAEGRKAEAVNANAQPSTSFATSRLPSTLNLQPSTSFVLSAPMPVVERDEMLSRTELGAAQHDRARELGVRFASLRGVVWVGVGLFIFGVASLVWPPLKAIIASATTSVALSLAGVALMFLPSLAGYAWLILAAVGAAIWWFVAYRHGHVRGMLTASTSKSEV